MTMKQEDSSGLWICETAFGDPDVVFGRYQRVLLKGNRERKIAFRSFRTAMQITMNLRAPGPEARRCAFEKTII